jgi:predicted DNA-binding WGR domain protein
MSQPDYHIHLECRTSGPTGGKFWIAAVYGRKAIVRWGPRSKAGQAKEYEFGNPVAAMRFIEGKEYEKRAKGYYQVSQSRPADMAMKGAAKQHNVEPPPIAIPSSRALSWDF